MEKHLYFVIGMFLFLAYSHTDRGSTKGEKQMKGIIVASFGTSYKHTLEKTIECIEARIVQAFKEAEVCRAFTSHMIIKKIKERDGIDTHTPQEAIEAMIARGIKDIHVQPLHVIPGYEYDKVKKAVAMGNHKAGVTISIGQPLLSQEDHYDDLIDAIFSEIDVEGPDHALVLMGHGTHHHANACYSMLQAKINDRTSHVYIANVEGYPEFDAIKDKLQAYDHVSLMPLMIVAGDHAINDMAGDEETSFKSILQGQGKAVTCILKGLGELALVQDIFVSRVQAGLQ